MKKIFEDLSKDKTSAVEAAISEKWNQVNILDKCIENREGKQDFVFYDGPATANGMPGLHHMLAKMLKDTFCKYKTMQGYRILRKVGWDTHGLPVELEVEKELGFKSKQDIEKYGIEKFNQKCRESVWRNEASFGDMTRKMGQFIDLEHPYVTYDNNYIESEWNILKKFFDAGLIYEGHKILPYCPRCGTGLATHEVAQGYKEIQVETVTVPMKMKNEDTYFLVWTTTPWTLLSNFAICVNPNEEYVKCLSKGNNFIVARKLASKVLGDDYEVIETYKGSDLEYIEYEQLLPFIEVNKKAFFVTCDTYVTMEDGTGIVHIAPAFGADDYSIGRRYDLPVINPVGEDGKYLTGPWQGTLVFDADTEIVKYLKENNKLFKKEKIMHNYPHCWRCETPLLYYSKPSWYIEVTKIRDKVVAANNKVNWYPKYVGEKRFGNWLEELNDWAISRSRYWGTPLPLWLCECGHKEMIGSIKELQDRAMEEVADNIDLHRPYVDDIHLECPHCHKRMNRVKDVIDCWFDSGSMPYAQYHYPFENEELFKNQFPADFICEGVDQTRGWFYTLIIIGTFLTGESPYKNVLCHDLMLDKYGKKMSKSKGNKVDPFDLMEKYGADNIRWYLPYVSPVWTPIKFDEDGLKEVYSKFFNPFRNTYSFFSLYANTDGVDPRTFTVEYNDLEEIDKWLLSKYNRLVKDTTNAYDEYDLTRVVRSVTDFVSEDLSNWYIRRNRKRFWGSELDNSKKAVYSTTYKVLEGLTKIIAPVVPFLSEEIYQKLTGQESVHLADYPVCDESLIDEKIEIRMDLVRNLISLGRAGREDAKIKVRQPISEVIIDGKHKAIIGDLTSLIEEELNVKQVTYVNDLSVYMNFEIRPNFKVAGPIFGSKIKLFGESLSKINNEAVNKLSNNQSIKLDIDNETYDINTDMVDIRITAKEGFNANMLNNNFIILNTTLTKNLIDEGIARELVSKVQNLRKTNNFDIIDRIDIYYDGEKAVEEAINKYVDFIKTETLCNNIQKKECKETFDLNGYNVGLEVNKI